jgi:ABC-type transport system involved in multi-copper enzyme maturation permease subunit
MAVYDRLYRPYAGPTTPGWSRFLVITRYALGDVFRSKLLVVFFTFCFVFPLLCAGAIYLRHNADLLAILGAMGAEIDDWVPIDGFFFNLFLRVQCGFAFFLVLFVGPRLISRDLANNGLALYLSRPFSQAEYVAGKVTILLGITSLVTWVPGLLLVLLQASLEGTEWLARYPALPSGVLLGSLVWIVVISFLALAISALVRWRPLAGFFLLAIYFAGEFFAFIVRQLFDTDAGQLVNIRRLIRIVWAGLLGTEVPEGPPGWLAWAGLAAIVAVSMLLLRKQIRAYEVVR